nr:hypothetical protein [uncultured Dysosmobacter sp.]
MGKRKRELSEFGGFLVTEIRRAGMSKVDFCTAVGINKPYFYESLTGTPPSQEILEKMLEVLNANLPAEDKIQANDLLDKAAKCRREIPADISDLIRAHPDQWNHIRTVLGEMLFTAK